MSIRPDVERTGDIWCRVSGLFHRAVNPAFQADALDGSRVAGRYSGPSQRTLYLSSSPEGVEAYRTFSNRAAASRMSCPVRSLPW